ncbi:MAG: nucleotidyltransferase family protein [Lachnospiraceae bacterium]
MNELANDLAYLVNLSLGRTEEHKICSSVEVIINLACSNQMQGLIFTSLVKEDIPEKEREIIRRSLKRSLFRTMIQLNNLKELEKHFEQMGVINQPMKGSCMKYMYPSPVLRDMGDIDILVDAESLEKCQRVMEDLGYDFVQDIKHHVVFQKKDGTVIEVHRALYDKTTDRTQYEYFLDLKNRTCKEGCRYTYQFDVNDFYIYMMAHMARHFYTMGCGVRNLVDIKVYLDLYQDEMDKTYVTNILQKLGLMDFDIHMRKMADIWLNHEESSPLYDDLFDYMLFSGVYGKDENGIWNKYAFQERKGKKDYSSKLKRWYLFPPYDYMVEYYPFLQKHKYMLPAMWMVRGFNGVFLHRGRKKVDMLKNIDNESIERITNIYRNMNLRFRK